MSIGGVRKVGRSRFPSVKRSTDVLQPESGDVDFSETLKDFDEEKSNSISETEVAEQRLIKENEERENLKKKKEQQMADEDEEKEDEDTHIDIQA